MTESIDGQVVTGYFPGLIGQVVSLHADYYSKHWHFGAPFETKVAAELAEFVQRYDESRDRVWSVLSDRGLDCSLTIDGSGNGRNAHLRWFIASENARGKGYGEKLLELALEFCRGCEFPGVYLWTFGGLDAARHLYEKMGFQICEEFEGDTWGRPVVEQRFEIGL